MPTHPFSNWSTRLFKAAGRPKPVQRASNPPAALIEDPLRLRFLASSGSTGAKGQAGLPRSGQADIHRSDRCHRSHRYTRFAREARSASPPGVRLTGSNRRETTIGLTRDGRADPRFNCRSALPDCTGTLDATPGTVTNSRTLVPSSACLPSPRIDCAHDFGHSDRRTAPCSCSRAAVDDDTTELEAAGPATAYRPARCPGSTVPCGQRVPAASSIPAAPLKGRYQRPLVLDRRSRINIHGAEWAPAFFQGFRATFAPGTAPHAVPDTPAGVSCEPSRGRLRSHTAAHTFR